MTPDKPLVLCFSGHDPTGGAGILADAQAIHALGAHALAVITANTVQDTQDVSRVVPTAPILLAAQVEALRADCRVAAIKIGLVGDAEQVPHLQAAITDCGVPAILDPVLRAGGGSQLSTARTVAALRELFGAVELLTPNAAEARRLAPGCSSLEACAETLLRSGCRNVLITGGDEPDAAVINTWYAHDAAPRTFEWQRLPGHFHGAGCTLAAAIAARRACGDALASAIEAGQRFTHDALRHAYAVGAGRRIPERVRAAWA
jgi:hydroxymethylpyrimidine/phosphomethylpyrimidine kinase